MFDRSSRKEVTLEASREVAKPKTMLKPRKVGGHIRNPDSAWFSRKCLILLRCALAGRGKRTRSLWIAWTSTRRSFTLPGIHRFLSNQKSLTRTFFFRKTFFIIFSSGEYYRSCCHKQSLPLPGDFDDISLKHRNLKKIVEALNFQLFSRRTTNGRDLLYPPAFIQRRDSGQHWK